MTRDFIRPLCGSALLEPGEAEDATFTRLLLMPSFAILPLLLVISLTLSSLFV
jgi:hypothetical protein